MNRPERPTMESLRAQCEQWGADWAKRYAALPGTGPAGTTCHSCKHKTYTGGANRFPKCSRAHYTHGDATTIKTRTPSCRLFEPKKPNHSPD